MNTPTVLTREQVRAVDRRAIEEFGMSGLVLMENAGRGCVDRLCAWGVNGPVVICCGKGNNAGDGFVMARHLALRGHHPRVLLWGNPEQLTGDSRVNCDIMRRMNLPLICFPATGPCGHLTDLAAAIADADWIVDAILGTGASGSPRPPLDAVLDQLNASPARKLAIDLPTGLDCDTGIPSPHTFRADYTCTFVALKRGFLAPEAQPFLGQVEVIDIGAPLAGNK